MPGLQSGGSHDRRAKDGEGHKSSEILEHGGDEWGRGESKTLFSNFSKVWMFLKSRRKAQRKRDRKRGRRYRGFQRRMRRRPCLQPLASPPHFIAQNVEPVIDSIQVRTCGIRIVAYGYGRCRRIEGQKSSTPHMYLDIVLPQCGSGWGASRGPLDLVDNQPSRMLATDHRKKRRGPYDPKVLQTQPCSAKIKRRLPAFDQSMKGLKIPR